MILAVVAVAALVVAGAAVVLFSGDKGSTGEKTSAYTVDVTGDEVNIDDVQAGIDKVIASDDLDTLSVVIPNSVTTGTTTDVTIQKEVVSALAGADAKLEVKTSTGSVTFDADTLNGLSEDLSLTVGVVTDPAATAAALGDDYSEAAAIISIDLKDGTNVVSNLDGKAVIKIPYALKDGDDVNYIELWYQTGPSSFERIEAEYKDGCAIATLEHFSDYYIAFMSPEDAAYYPVTVTTYIGGNAVQQTFTHQPHRVFTCWSSPTEMMCYLGLEDLVVGAYTENGYTCMYPELQSAYDKLNKYPSSGFSIEQVIGLEVDCIIGWSSTFTSDKYLGSDYSVWNARGTNCLVTNRNSDTLNDYLTILDMIGTAFNCKDVTDEKKANFTNAMTEISYFVQDIPANEKTTALILEIGYGASAFTYGASFLTGDLITCAGGVNLYPNAMDMVAYETIAGDYADVDVIILFGDDSTIEEFRNIGAFGTLSQNARLYAFSFNQLYMGGLMQDDILSYIYNCLYPAQKSNLEDAAYVAALKTAKLPVLGNENGDMELNQDDYDAIKALVKAKASAADHPLADANRDGVIDLFDLAVVKAAIGGKETTIYHLQYHDYDKDGVMDYLLESTKFPIKSSLITGSTNTALLTLMLGITDKVAGASYSSLDKTLFGNNLLTKVRTGTSSTTISLEDATNTGAANVIKTNKVTAVLTDWNRSYVTNQAAFEALGVDVVRVPAASTNTADAVGGMLLVGFLYQSSEQAKSLAEFYETTMTQMEGIVSSISDSDKVKAVASSTTGAVSSGDSDYTAVLRLAGAEWGLEGYDFNNSSSIKIADNLQIYTYDFNYIVHLRTSLGFTELAASKVSGYWNEYTSPFAYWSAASDENKQIMVSGTVPIPFRVAYTITQLYPAHLDKATVDGMVQTFVTDYLGLDIDVSKLTLVYSADVQAPEEAVIDYSTAVLLVYGNANEDDKMDAADVAIIQEIIDGTKSFADYPLADANYDGKITADDVAVVEKLIAGETTSAYVKNQLTDEDLAQLVTDGVSKSGYTVVKVTYPLANTVIVNSDLTSLYSQLGTDAYVAGYISKNYANSESSKILAAQKLGTGARQFDEASYKGLIDLGAALSADSKKIGAIVVYNVNALNGYEKNFANLNIPVVVMKVTMAKQSLSSFVTLGFLYGKTTEVTGREYAADSLAVYNFVSSKVATLQDADKLNTISVCMYYYVAQKQSQYVEAAELAGGVDQCTVAGTGSDKISSTEAIEDWDIDAIFSFNTQGYTKLTNAEIVSLFEYKGNAEKFMKCNDAYPDHIYYLNNSLPIACRVACIAETLYPDLFDAGYGVTTFQSFVDKYISYLDTCVEDGDFDAANDMTLILSFQDYVNAGGTTIKSKVAA